MAKQTARAEQVQLRAIADLMDLRPARVLFGGWAEDALLHGKPSRPHDDIDLLVPLGDLADVIGQVETLGFRDPHVKFQVEDGRPVVVSAFREGVELELIVYQVDARGRAFFDLPVGPELRRFEMPTGALSHPPGRLGDIQVRTISPLALYHVREFSQHVFGGFRDKDRVTQAALKERFFRATPERELQPRVTSP
jgi:hypothetical protein